ncbi:MAG TPA: hypothetical protein PLC38_02250 [Methanobacterium sp.]|jgi:transposase-like protein|nr:MAG: hypothetical protein FGO69_05710 [Methanobacterium sp.]HOI71088.1 hypothetical protein [Methanobacterium sp.]
MTKISELEKMDFDKFKKPKDRELVFVPKDEFLEWYKRSKSVEADIEMVKAKIDHHECPNCKGGMEGYELKHASMNELWYLCPACDYSISEKRNDTFAMTILRVLNEIERESKV